MFISYSQNFEDVMLWRALGHVPSGRYVDIGAQSPVVDSVSLVFYENGWRGIHVEPNSQYAEELRHARSDETVIQAVVGCERGAVKFYEMAGTGLSTVRPDIAGEHAAGGFAVNETVTAAITLDDVLAQAGGEVHWLKIDVEGAEEQVFRGWLSNDILPWVVVVESTLPMSRISSHEPWEPVLLEKGYRFVYFDGLNRFYIANDHPELAGAFEVAPNVFDGFSLAATSNSPFRRAISQQLDDLKEALALADQRIATREAECERAQSELESTKCSQEAAVDHMVAAENELRELRNGLELAQREAESIKLAAALAESRALTKELELAKSMSWLSSHAKRLEIESIQMSGELAAMKASASWRLTAPLRLAARAIQAVFRIPLRMYHVSRGAAKALLRRLISWAMRIPLLRRIGAAVFSVAPSIKRRIVMATTTTASSQTSVNGSAYTVALAPVPPDASPSQKHVLAVLRQASQAIGKYAPNH
jgi:FkbM family methyltransferase